MSNQNQERRVLILIITLTVTPVNAQTVPTDELQQTQTQSTPLTETQGIELAPITITGERVERAVEDTASSVTVITDEVLPSLAGPDRVDTVLSLTPNVQQFGNNNSGPTIRGQDTTGVLNDAEAFLGGSRPRTTIQIDGRPISFNEFIYGFSSIWDVERIEVFNGPQTTTQGANSIAGAIFVETKDPTFDFESSARAIIAEENTRQFSGVISGPLLGDELAGRLAIDYRTHETFLDLPNATQDIGEPRDEEQYLIARAKLLYEPTNLPGLSTQLTLSLNDVTRLQTEIVSADPTQGIEFKDRINVNSGIPVWRTDSDTVIADIDYDFVNDWSISNTLTYSQTDIERLTLPGEGIGDIDGEELSNETLLSYASPETNLSGFIGTYYRRSDNDEFIDLDAFIGTGEFEDTNTSVALFGELTWVITPQLDLTLGGRYQRDSQDRDGTLGPLTVDYDETFTAFLPKFSLAYGISDTLTIGATVVKGFNPGGTTVSFDTGEEDFFAEETL
jgi:outer membrane receptor protein involved in Fe transport